MKAKLIIILWVTLGFGSELTAQSPEADSLFVLGDQLSSEANYQEAGEHYQKAMELYLQEHDSVKWAEASLDYGKSLVNSGSVREGLDVFLELDAKKTLRTPQSIVIKILNNAGWAYRNLEQPETAKKYYLKGLELASSHNDSLILGQLNNNISYVYQETNDYEKAYSHQLKAKEIYEVIEDEYRVSFALNALFLTMMDLGLYQQAESYIRQSLAIREEIGNPDMLDVGYHNLAWNFERQGKRDSAIIYYQKSLELSRMLENPYDITQTLINIGDLYKRSGGYDNALAYYNEALQTNYQTERPVSIAKNLMRLAEVAIKNKDLVNAESFYQEALTWLDEATAPRTLANLFLNFVNLEILRENYPEAKKYISSASEISRDKNFGSLNVRSHNLLGELYKTEGKLHESLAEYHKAYELSSGQTVTGKISPAMNMSRAYHEIRSDSAFTFAEEAFTLIDSIRTNVAGVAFRSGFFREHAGFYNEVASWYVLQKNNPDKAFELIEAAKSRVLMDELAEAQEKVYETLDEATLIKRQQKAKQIDRLYNQLAAAKTEEEISAVRNELKDLEFDYQSFLNEIQVSTPELKDFKYPKSISAKKAVEMLDSETAILEYAFSGNKLTRFIITKNEISAAVIDSVGNEHAKSYLTQKIKSFRNDLVSQAPVEKLKDTAEEMYQVLIPKQGLEKISNLVIIPDGVLSFLPFEVLNTNSEYLIESNNIKYLPSASIYTFIKNPHRSTTFDLLAIAGSGFEGTSTVSTVTRSFNSFASLPSTLLEVESIAANFNGSKVLKNEHVTEASVKSENLQDYRFLHFATHGIIDEDNPSQSGLLLSRNTEEESAIAEDGFLNSNEIAGLKLKADLVILSACNTGMGKLITGEGLLGLQRSFLTAGASSVIVSLWNVYDRSTSEFMTHFYRKMMFHEAEDYDIWNRSLNWFGWYDHPLFDYKSKALRDAKLAMIDHPYYNHPVHWAPFILIGK